MGNHLRESVRFCHMGIPPQSALLHCGQQIFKVTHALSDSLANFFICGMFYEGDAKDSLVTFHLHCLGLPLQFSGQGP